MTTPSELRIGDAERDAVAVALHDHFAQGRLTLEEMDERLAATLTAKTQSDLGEVVKDLPGPNGLAEAEPTGHGRGPWSEHRHGHRHRDMRGRPHGHMHRHGPPPVVPLLFLFLILSLFVGGVGTAFVIALKVMVVLWLGMAVFGVLRFRRRRQKV